MMLVIWLFAAVGLLSGACIVVVVLYLGSLCQQEGITIIVGPENRSEGLPAVIADAQAAPDHEKSLV